MKHHITAALPLALLFPAMAPAQSAFDLGEVVFSVNATETQDRRVGNSVSILDEEDLRNAGDLQLSQILTRLPGVALSQNGPQGTAGDIRIRGAQGRYINVYIDGILVTDPSGTTIAYDDFGGLTAGSIRRIELLRGSQSALYGGTAVGGVINITTIANADTPEGTTQTLGIEAGSYNTYALNYGLTQRTGPLTLSFGVDHVRSDGFSAAEENTGNTEADGFDRSRLSFGAIYAVNDALSVGFNAFVEDGTAEFDEFGAAPIDGTPDETASRDAFGLRVFAEWQLANWSHEVALSQYDVERVSRSNGRTSTFNGNRLAFDYVGAVSVSDQLALSFGLNAMQEEAVYANAPGGRAAIDTYGAFLETVWSPTTDLDLTATLRRDDHETFGGQTTGRLAFAWRPGANTVIRGAVGTGYRPPSIDELFGNYPGLFPFVGNASLVPEESLSAELGVEHVFANGARLSATAFRLDIENLVTFRSGTPSTLVNIPGTSTRRGLELAGSLPVGDVVTLTGAYTYTDAKDAQNLPLPLIPEHDIALGLDAEWGDGWSANLTAQRVIGTVESNRALPNYTVFNASLGYALSDGVEAYVRVENLFDEQYQTRRGYGTSDRAFYLGLRARF